MAFRAKLNETPIILKKNARLGFSLDIFLVYITGI